MQFMNPGVGDALDTHVYQWNGSVWMDLGPGGVPGPIGPIGPIGAQGIDGSYWFVATGPPPAFNAAIAGITPRVRDAYLDTVTGMTYWVVGAAWTQVASIKGIDGTYWLVGAGAPPAYPAPIGGVTPREGDLYFNTSTGNVRQVQGGVWVDLPGDLHGTYFFQGTAPPPAFPTTIDGITPRELDLFVDTVTGFVYQVNAGVWTQQAGGLRGPQGIAGPAGNTYLESTWRHSATVGPPPNTGSYRLDATGQTLYLHHSDLGGTDQTLGVSALEVGDQIHLRTADANYLLYTVTSVLNGGTYHAFGLLVVAQDGVISTNETTTFNLVHKAPATIWHQGTAPPPAYPSVISGVVPHEGDFYIDTVTGRVYQVEASTWVLQPGGLMGPEGSPGGSVLTDYWIWRAATTAPATGEIRRDASLRLMIHDVSTGAPFGAGIDRTPFLSLLAVEDYVYLRTQTGARLIARVTAAPTDLTTYWRLTVVTTASGGAFNDGDVVRVDLVPTVIGPTGIDGTYWLQGATTPPAFPAPISSVTPREGDFYLDTYSGEVYQVETGVWVNQTGGLMGPIGPPGPATLIVDDFVTRLPSELPLDGLIPIDWDGVGNPAAAYQLNVGESLYYAPLDPFAADAGHLFQYVSTATDPTGWIDLGIIRGPQGVPGPPGPASLEVWIDPAAPAPRGDYTIWIDTDQPDPANPLDALPQGLVADVQPAEKGINTTSQVWATVAITGLPKSSLRRFLWVLTPQMYAAGTTGRSFSFGVPGMTTGGRELLMPAPVAGGYPGTTYNVIGRALTDANGAVNMDISVQLRSGAAVTFLGSGGGISQRSRIQVFDMGAR
jgi:hypothetical protein